MLQTVISLSISLAADVGKQTMYHVVNTFLFLSLHELFVDIRKLIYKVTKRICSMFTIKNAKDSAV